MVRDMKCKCGSRNHGVIDSRPCGEYIRRRRKCEECGLRWSTYEMSDEEVQVLHSRDSSRKLKALLKAIAAAGVA